jgi:DNA repair protein RecO
VVQKSFGAGEMTGDLFNLFLGCLRLLNAPDAVREPYVTIQFLWRFLSLAGYQPETRACERCGAAQGDTHPAYYSSPSNAILCQSCRGPLDDVLPAGSLRYLDAIARLPLDRSIEVRLEPAGLRALQHTLPRMVQSVLEGELASLRWVGAPR